MPSLHLLDEFELTGRSRSHLVESGVDVAGSHCMLHRAVMPAFIAMRERARIDGIDLRAASSFRDFDRQLAIWNGKFRGERSVSDRAGRPVDITSLPPLERIETILFWSALPGASRHHWGTDFDVYDAAALREDSVLQLIPQEYAVGGPFAKLAVWLDTHLHEFGFFRPYVAGGQGVSAEPWHVSFAPIAVRCLEQLSPQLLGRVLAAASLEGREAVLARLDDLHRRFVADVAHAPRELVDFELGDHRRMV